MMLFICDVGSYLEEVLIELDNFGLERLGSTLLGKG
jgi:hypothetical protein